MRNLLFILFIPVFALSKPQIVSAQTPYPEESARQRVADREDPSKWDMERLEQDKKYMEAYYTESNMLHGFFPEPHYGLVKEISTSYVGVGNVYGEKEISGKTIVYESYYVQRNELNTARIGDKPEEVFFQVIVLTDFIDNADYSHYDSSISSRNHPDYLGSGTFKTKDSRVDFTAFITATGDSYALVNLRLFSLKYGKTILVAPQKDGTFRSMQVESPIMSSEEVKPYTDNLLREQKIVDFFYRPRKYMTCKAHQRPSGNRKTA